MRSLALNIFFPFLEEETGRRGDGEGQLFKD